VELVHTGQHSDAAMSAVFLDQFGMRPDHVLDITAASANARIARIMLGLEPVLTEVRPSAMVVVGDVDSTLAAALSANKCGIPLVHLEAGLRCGDMAMPEEVNRILVDRIAQHALVTEPSGCDNLRREGMDPASVHLVGNTMIDTLKAFAHRIEAATILNDLGLGAGGHVLLTLHRPANVDDPLQLSRSVELIAALCAHHRVVFPVHPRTRRSLEEHGLWNGVAASPNLTLTGPLDYFAFQQLVARSVCVITDSGGIQEETTYLRIPCLTLRPSTERPITVTKGSNTLVPFDAREVLAKLALIRAGKYDIGEVPELWDGHATERVFDVLERVL
jgi:UDP-N-acetylglucosamine 2-epimerase (non-hydrolysing)